MLLSQTNPKVHAKRIYCLWASVLSCHVYDCVCIFPPCGLEIFHLKCLLQDLQGFVSQILILCDSYDAVCVCIQPFMRSWIVFIVVYVCVYRWLEVGVANLTCTQYWVTYLQVLQDAVWPGGHLPTQPRPPRTKQQKDETKQQSLQCLMKLVPGSVAPQHSTLPSPVCMC